MKILHKLSFLSALCLATVVMFSDNAKGQELKIVNQDGEKVNPDELGNKPAASVQVQAGQDGKIIITDANGNAQELNLNGARNIIVNQSVRSTVENGEEKNEAIGKAIIVGPDGERHEIEFTPGEGIGAGLLPGMVGGPRWSAKPKGKQFMIGVHCSPVSPLVTSQLRLEEGTGLGVDHIQPGSPAEAAGFKKHDILLFADDRQLSSIKDLNEAVQTAGKEESKISFNVLREGKEVSLDASPVERPANQGIQAFQLNGANGFPGGEIFEFRGLGPGMMIEFDQDAEEMARKMQERMMEQSKRMRAEFDMIEKRMKQLRQEFDDKKQKQEEDF